MIGVGCRRVAQAGMLVAASSLCDTALAQSTLTFKEITEAIERNWDIHFERLVEKKQLPPAKVLPKLASAEVAKCEPVGNRAVCVIKVRAFYTDGVERQADYQSWVRNADEVINALVSGAVQSEVRN